MWIQIVLIFAVFGVAALLNRSTADARHQAIRRLLLLAFVIGAATSIIFPQWLTAIANVVGVGRGADLLLYALVIAFLGFIASTHRRTAELTAQITSLTRELTLFQARHDDGAGDTPQSGVTKTEPEQG